VTGSRPSYDLVVESAPGETRAALLNGEVLSELLVLRRTDGPRRREIHLGRVLRIERALNAAFVEIGAAAPGFLPLSGPARRVREGESLMVSVSAEAARGKGPRLAVGLPPMMPPARAAEIAKAAEVAAAPACLYRETDLAAAALRAFAEHDLDRIVADGAACFARLRAVARAEMPEREDRLVLHSGPEAAFETLAIEEQIEGALAPEVALASGLRLHIGETEALDAIDVDAASFAPRRGARATALGANLAAVPAIAREIRLRNLSGLIVVDFLRMKDAAERTRLAEAVAKTVAADPVPLHVHGFTRAGLFELTRERRRRPLSQVLLEPRSPRRKTAETVAREALRAACGVAVRAGSSVGLRAAPDVAGWLEREGKDDLAALESLLHVKLLLRPDPGFAREKFEIIGPAR